MQLHQGPHCGHRQTLQAEKKGWNEDAGSVMGNVAMAIDHFTTARLTIRSLLPDIKEEAKRRSLETALATILSSRVLKLLPPPLQLDHENGNISDWVDARVAEGNVLTVSQSTSGKLIGLLIMAPEPDTVDVVTIHFGYLLAEAVWGQGLATELVSGLVSGFKGKGPVRLVGGVDKRNKASARVLSKAGFQIDYGISKKDTDLFVRVVE